jgi:hypothetical protein
MVIVDADETVLAFSWGESLLAAGRGRGVDAEVAF